jgi:carbon-monoxide dehydrogenase small subunit
MLAVQADGRDIRTVESLAESDERLHPLQSAFREAHGLQCGFCTPGILMTLVPFLRDNPRPDADDVREALSGNLCRCTGYHAIVEAVLLAAERMAASEAMATTDVRAGGVRAAPAADPDAQDAP